MATEAPALILPKKSKIETPQFQGFLDKTSEDTGSWLDYGEYSSEFEPALGIFLNGHIDIEWDPTMPLEKAKEQSQIGYREFKVGKHFTVGLNWKRSWERSLPPHHMGIQYKDRVVGFLSPLMEVRTCWKCGAYGWHHIPLDERLRDPGLPDKIPFCAPGLPCPGRGQIVDGHPVDWTPCGHMDWVGDLVRGEEMVSRGQFQMACAEQLARMEDDDRIFEDMSIAYDQNGEAYRIKQ